MAQTSIPVDLWNPGQVFACLGFMEAAEVLLGDTGCVFDSTDASQDRFHIATPGVANPITTVLEFLSEAKVSAVVPWNAAGDPRLSTEKWKLPTTTAGGERYPFPAPEAPATLPALLEAPRGRRLVVDHWGDGTERDAVKFWAGAGGYPGAGLLRDALNLVRDRLADAPNDPFSLASPQSSAFRLDWRRDYVPIDVGFSPNAHGNRVVMLGYPLVEILAAIGLGHARPRRSGRDKLHYRYGVIGTSGCEPFLVAPSLHRAALGAVALPFPQRFFEMRLGWPGKVGQARCILEVTEEDRS